MEKSWLNIEIGTVSCMEKLRVESEWTMPENHGVTLKNQRHCFQLVLKNKQIWALYQNRVVVTGDLTPFITVKVVDSVPAEFTFIGQTDDYYLGGSGVYPDVLRDYRAGDIVLPPSGNKCLWICVESDTELPIGVHKIGFQAIDAKGCLMGETEYELEVLDACITKADIKKTNWMHYDSICYSHDVEPFTTEFYSIFDKYLSAYVRSGFNMLLTPIFTPALDTYVGGERMTVQLVDIKYNDDEYTFDFIRLKAFLDFVFARGIKYIEFSHLFTQWGGEHCPKVMAVVDGEYKKIFGWESDSCAEEYKAFLNAFLPQLVAFIKQEGIENKCCFHITDEPNEKHLKRYKECRELVKKHIGEIPTMDAISHYEYYEQGLVDIPIPELRHIGKFLENNAEDTLAYYCCEPSDCYYSNRFLNMPLQRTRILGCQLYQTGVNGFLHWGFNFYNSGLSYTQINPYAVTNAGGAFPPGDGFIVYPKENGVNLSMRSEIMRMAFEDYDLLYMLAQKIGAEKVKKMLEREGVSGYTTYPHSAEWHTKFIEKVKRAFV